MAKYQGQVWVVGDDVDTDLIIAARYLNQSGKEHLKKHCLEDLIPDFDQKITEGDILVAGKNFGCGSSREHAPLAIKSCGISCVIAESFARIFYRNAINIGLPIFSAPEAARALSQGERVVVDSEVGVIENLRTAEEFKAEKFPEFIQKIIESGNLLNYVRGRIAGND